MVAVAKSQYVPHDNSEVCGRVSTFSSFQTRIKVFKWHLQFHWFWMSSISVEIACRWRRIQHTHFSCHSKLNFSTESPKSPFQTRFDPHFSQLAVAPNEILVFENFCYKLRIFPSGLTHSSNVCQFTSSVARPLVMRQTSNPIQIGRGQSRAVGQAVYVNPNKEISTLIPAKPQLRKWWFQLKRISSTRWFASLAT